MCVRKVKDTLKDSVYAELKNVIKKWEIGSHFEITKSPLSIINKITGSEFIFR
jgi:phage terminase large subunit